MSMNDETGRPQPKRPAKRSEINCPMKENLVDRILAGEKVTGTTPSAPLREMIYPVNRGPVKLRHQPRPIERHAKGGNPNLPRGTVRCPALKDCAVCHGGPCLWRRSQGGHL